MASLTDYLDAGTLQQLQDAFTAVAQVPIRICDLQGQPLTREASVFSPAKPPQLPTARRGRKTGAAAPAGPALRGAPVLLEDQCLGQIIMEDGKGEHPERSWLPQLMAAMIARLYDREMQLRSRATDLATLYNLTGEFSARKDIQSVLDTVARTVVEVMKAKGCSIRLLSEDRRELVIKAVYNLSPEYLNKGPILLDSSLIDKEVLATGKPLYVADERTDPRVLYPAQAAREGIVSALVAPMSYKGRAEGILRVYMGQEHVFDWFEASLLEAIAAQAAAALVNARLYEEAVRSTAIMRQLRLAADVQRAMIPADMPAMEGFQIAAAYTPCFELGGDFYDFIDLPPDNMGIAICDVSGKGVRASLLMASIRASLRAHAANIYGMSDVLARVNRDLCLDRLTSDFATLFYAVLDYRARQLTYVNAGHPPPMLLRDGNITTLCDGGGVIGLDENQQWPCQVLSLQSGDVLLAYTDGLSEAMNFEDVAFGHARVAAAVKAACALAPARGGEPACSAQSILKHVIWELHRFTGLQSQNDDLTIVAIKVL